MLWRTCRRKFPAPLPLSGNRMGKASRDKGKRGERELAARLRDYGYDCRRGQQFCGRNGDADVVGLPGIHIECKRVERLNLLEAMKQSVEDAVAAALTQDRQVLPAVFHRRDRECWLVTMRLSDWIEIYREWDSGNQLKDMEGAFRESVSSQDECPGKQ